MFFYRLWHHGIPDRSYRYKLPCVFRNIIYCVCYRNYVLSLTFVFDTKKGNKIKEFIIFVVLSVIGLGINQLLMWFSVDILGIFYMISKIGATAVVMVYNFITRKLILEKK